MSSSEKNDFLISGPVQGKEALEDVFHDLIAGVLGLPGQLVRPTSQLYGVKAPGDEVDWCAFDVRQLGAAGGTAEITHVPDAQNGHDRLVTHKPVQVLLYFYGPGASELADALVDGLQVEQNRAILRKNNMGFVNAGPQVAVPENRNAKWLARTDLTLNFNRQVTREYAVKDISSVSGGIITDKHGGPGVRIDVQE